MDDDSGEDDTYCGLGGRLLIIGAWIGDISFYVNG